MISKAWPLTHSAKIPHEVNAHPSTEEHDRTSSSKAASCRVSTAQGAVGRDAAALVGASALNLQRLLAEGDPAEPVAIRGALCAYEVGSASAADYDRLLEAVVG